MVEGLIMTLIRYAHSFNISPYMVVSFQRLLNSFVSRLFSVKSFEVDFPLVSNVDGVRNVIIPEGIR